VSRASDVLTQTVLAEHVDDVRVDLASGDAWHVEIADDDKSVAEQHDMVEHVGELVSERRRDGSRRSVGTDDD